MARKHWTQLSQSRRREGTAIGDSDDNTTWQRGYAGAGAWRVSDSGLGGGYRFLGFTRVKFNASIKKANTKRDYKFNQYTMKQGHIFNRPVYRVTSKKKK